MKKMTALLVLILVLFASASFAEDLSGLNDQELMILHQEVLAELERRGIQYGDEGPGSDLNIMEGDEIVLHRMTEFFSYWNEFNMDNMLTLCLPEWKEEVGNPRPALFQLLLNRTPLDLIPESVSGDPDDPVRTIQASSVMDRNNGQDPVRYRLRIQMKKSDDGLWYIDPQSLKDAEILTDNPAIIPTPEPESSTGSVSGSTLLYFVPEGGQYYHLDPNCKTVNPKFLPMGGSFTYAEVNNEPYRDRNPCPVCEAPSREE